MSQNNKAVKRSTTGGLIPSERTVPETKLAKAMHFVHQRGPGAAWAVTGSPNLGILALIDWEYWLESLPGVEADAIPNMLESVPRGVRLRVRYNCPQRAFSAQLLNIWVNEDHMNTALQGPSWALLNASYPYCKENVLELLCMTNAQLKFGWDLIVEELTTLQPSKLSQTRLDSAGDLIFKEINEVFFDVDLTKTAKQFRQKTQDRALDQSLKKVRCFTIIFVDHHIPQVSPGMDHTDGMTAQTDYFATLEQANSKRIKFL